MKIVIQKVSRAEVVVDNKLVNAIGTGLLLLVGVEEADGQEDIAWLQRKILNMRIFNDADDKMNLSILDVQGEILAISQFTLHASTKKGNRPSFIKAARPEHAEEIYDQFCTALGESIPVKKGIFGAYMEVSLVNDGPVTIVIDSKNRE